MIPVLEDLPDALLLDRHKCLVALLASVSTASNEHEAKMWIRAYVNHVGPRVLSLTWVHDKPAIMHLLYRATTKPMLALAAGLINLLPEATL